MQRRDDMYRVIYDSGWDGWQWEEQEFQTAEEALSWAMKEGRSSWFRVVKLVEFKEVKE